MNPTASDMMESARQLHMAGRLPEAEAIYRRILAQSPDHADALHYMGLLAHQVGRNDVALDLIKRAIARNPDQPSYYNNLGHVLTALGRIDQAVEALQTGVRLRPESAEGQNNLGIALCRQGYAEASIVHFTEALRRKPDFFQAWNNLGNAHRQEGRLDQAVDAYQTAVKLKPDFANAHYNLGTTLKDQGDLDRAIEAYQRAIELDPSDPTIHDGLLFLVHFHPDYDGARIRQEHERWYRRHAQPLARFIQPHANDRNPDRPLRIGYVAAHFYDHCQAFFTLPLLRNHDRSQFEIYCYSMSRITDAITSEYEKCAQGWRNIVGVPDDQVAEMIRADRIDILVDCTLHMSDNRLLVFARKPAPVQVTWIGYPASTGLAAIDYRLSDSHMDPQGLNDAEYCEQTICLPNCFWCYDPLTDQPQVNPLPARRGAPITFGCLNNFCKVNQRVLELWAQVLKAVPNSRLMLLSDPGSHRDQTLASLELLGVEPARVEMVHRRPRPEYLGLYHRIDIALDTFPYTGHTTTLDALWMGVPVVSLPGTRAVSRATLSVATNLGLEKELIAKSPDQYVRLARNLTEDLPKLGSLRGQLRSKMQESPIMDPATFARGMERTFRQIWRKWCNQGDLSTGAQR